MTASTERIVVQTTPGEKEAIAEKAKRMGLSISELMRRGAVAYAPAENEAQLGVLADEAARAAQRAGESIDRALEFVKQSNGRIATMERAAAARRESTSMSEPAPMPSPTKGM